MAAKVNAKIQTKTLVPAAIVGFVIGFTLWSYLRSTGLMTNDNVMYALLLGVVGAIASALGGTIAMALGPMLGA